MRRRLAGKSRNGSALVEFGLTALVLYMLLAGGIELGRSIFVSQVLHEAARVAAREFSVTPMSADCVFENALANLCGADVQANIWNPNLLVIDVACNPSPDQLKGFVDNLPLLNRALTPVFIYDNVVAAGTERKLLRYPGALLGVIAHDPPTLGCPQAATDLTVAVPRVRDRTATLDPVTGVPAGTETIDWVPVLGEDRGAASNPSCGAFSMVSPDPPPADCAPGYNPNTAPRGIVTITLNYPFQSGALTAFQQKLATEADPNNDPLARNLGYAAEADDLGVTQIGAMPPNTMFVDPEPPDCPPTETCQGIYAGNFGLGRQYALAKTVRPYRSLLQAQAIFRREVTN